MKRRTILKSSIAVGFGISAAGFSTFLSGCEVDASDGWSPSALSSKQASLLAEICERIIPRTNTPGAKDALVHRTIDQFITDNLSEGDQSKFTGALAQFDEQGKTKFNKSFVKLTDEEKDSVLDAVADLGGDENIFEAIRQMTISTFFTSELGAKEVLKFDPVPGVWQSCIPLSEVGGTWAL